MKCNLLLLFILLNSSATVVGQDHIVIRDSTEMECKAEEIGEDRISFRNWTNLQGPIYSIDKTKVSHILFRNGMRETFSKPRHVGYTIMLQEGYAFFSPVGRQVAKMGESGLNHTAIFRISAFLDAKKTISLSTTAYWTIAETQNIGGVGMRLSYTAFGFNTIWNYHWLRWHSGSLYSGMGIGFVQEQYDYFGDTSPPFFEFREDRSGIGFQIDLIGVHYSPFRHFGLFAKLGGGYEGIFQLGIQTHW